MSKKLSNVQNEVFLTDLVFQKEFLGCSFTKFHLPLAFPNLALEQTKKQPFWAIGENSRTSDLREWESYYGVSTHAPAGVNGQYVQRVRQWDKCGERRLSSARLSHLQHFYHYQPTLRGTPNSVEWNLINDTVKKDFCRLNHVVPDWIAAFHQVCLTPEIICVRSKMA